MPGDGLPVKGGPGHLRGASSWCLEEGGQCTAHTVSSTSPDGGDLELMEEGKGAVCSECLGTHKAFS